MSAGALSGEYGSCSIIFVEFITRNSFTMIAVEISVECSRTYEGNLV